MPVIKKSAKRKKYNAFGMDPVPVIPRLGSVKRDQPESPTSITRPAVGLTIVQTSDNGKSETGIIIHRDHWTLNDPIDQTEETESRLWILWETGDIQRLDYATEPYNGEPPNPFEYIDNGVYIDPQSIYTLRNMEPRPPNAPDGAPKKIVDKYEKAIQDYLELPKQVYKQIMGSTKVSAHGIPAEEINIGIGEWYFNSTGNRMDGTDRDAELKWLICLREIDKFEQIKDFCKSKSSTDLAEFGVKKTKDGIKDPRQIKNEVLAQIRANQRQKKSVPWDAYRTRLINNAEMTETEVKAFFQEFKPDVLIKPTTLDLEKQQKIIFDENIKFAIPGIIRRYYPHMTDKQALDEFVRLFSGTGDEQLLKDIIINGNLQTRTPNDIIRMIGEMMGITSVPVPRITKSTLQAIFTSVFINFLAKGMDVSQIPGPELKENRDMLTQLSEEALSGEHRVYVDALSGASAMSELTQYFQELINEKRLSVVKSGIDVLDGSATEDFLTKEIFRGNYSGVKEEYKNKDVVIDIKDPFGNTLIKYTITYKDDPINGNYDIILKRYFELDCSDVISIRKNKLATRSSGWHFIKDSEVLEGKLSDPKMKADICFKAQKTVMDITQSIIAEHDIVRLGLDRSKTSIAANDIGASIKAAIVTSITDRTSTPCLLFGTSERRLTRHLEVCVKRHALQQVMQQFGKQRSKKSGVDSDIKYLKRCA